MDSGAGTRRARASSRLTPMSPPNDDSRPRGGGGSSSSSSSSQSSARHRQDSGARRRRQASQRLAPLASGTRDPWAARKGAEAVTADPFSALASKRMSDRAWLAACRRLENLAEDSVRHRRNQADLLRPRDDDYRGRGHLHHGLAA